MVYLELHRDNTHLLKITGDLAERFDADVIGISASQPLQLVYSSGALTGEIVELDRMEISKGMEVAESQFRAALGPRARRVEWRSRIADDPPADYVTRQARSADLIISGVEQSGSFFGSPRCVNTSDLVMQAGRPVLIIPPQVKELVANNVVFGWKETREARHAIVDALPFLQTTKRTVVVEVADSEGLSEARTNVDDVVTWLKQRGVPAVGIASPVTGNEAVRLEAIAEREGADLIVAGAYGHSRFREWVLGGVTYDLLLRANICTLVSH
jgi:nucleotide-binding universal stress UspA family protein